MQCAAHGTVANLLGNAVLRRMRVLRQMFPAVNRGDCGPGSPTCMHLDESMGSKTEVGVTSPLDTERNKVRDYVRQLSIVS